MASTATIPEPPATTGKIEEEDVEMELGGRRHRGSRKGRRGTRKTRKASRKQSKWMQHVMATKRANKGKDLTEVLKMASETYKKGGMEGGSDSTGGGVAAGAAHVTGGKKTRKAKKSRKY